MTTSNSYNFNPAIGETVLYAYSMIGIGRTSVTAEHMTDAHMAVNLMLGEWANKGVNLWEVKLGTINLVQGTKSYSIPANAAMIMDAYIETDGTSSNPIDRVVTPISRSEYSSYPDKEQQGPPTVYWFDRLLAPSVILRPVPDDGGPYTFNYYYVSQIQDANFPGGETVDIPSTWMRAFASGIAAELCPGYAPDREQARRLDAERSFQIAAGWNTENAPVRLTPVLASYYR